MDAEITKADGTVFKLSDYGIMAQDFVVGSIEVNGTYSNVDGRHGTVDMGAVFGSRSITVPFYYKAPYMPDIALMRDELAGLIVDTEPFYIREIRRVTYNGDDNQLVGGKRYLVRLSSTFNIDQTFQYGFGELQFETTDLPFAESQGTTQDIQSKGIDADSALWGFGMGLIADDNSLKYTFNGANSFRVYNAGNVGVHPFMQALKITISNVAGSSSYFELRNATNGTKFHVNNAVTSSQTIVIDGPNVTSNGLAYLRNTTKEFIELAPGWNTFTITGAASANVAFDFRFYYR